MQDLFNQFVLENEDFRSCFKYLNCLYRGEKYFEMSVTFENDKKELFCKKIEVQLEPFGRVHFKIMGIIKENKNLEPSIDHCWFMLDKDRDKLIQNAARIILSRFRDRFGLNIKSID